MTRSGRFLLLSVPVVLGVSAYLLLGRDSAPRSGARLGGTAGPAGRPAGGGPDPRPRPRPSVAAAAPAAVPAATPVATGPPVSAKTPLQASLEALDDLCRPLSREQLDVERVKAAVVDLRQRVGPGPLADGDAESLIAAYDAATPSGRGALLLLFRHVKDGRLVDAVFRHRGEDPRASADALQWLGTDLACDHLETMMTEEEAPDRRLRLIENIAGTGAPSAADRLLRVLDAGAGGPAELCAIACLSKTPTEAARARLRNLVEAAAESDLPRDREVREAAVASLLRIGDAAEIDRLFAADPSSPLGAAVGLGLPQVKDPSWIRPVIERILALTRAPAGYLDYVGHVARPEDEAALRGLLDAGLPPADREHVERILRGIGR